MLELLEYSFFRNALAGVLLLSIGAGILGTYIVTQIGRASCRERV